MAFLDDDFSSKSKEERLSIKRLVVDHICERVEQGLTLKEICKPNTGLPSPHHFMRWVYHDDPPGTAAKYNVAVETCYRLKSDEIEQIASETHAYTVVGVVDVNGDPVYGSDGKQRTREVVVPLSSEVIASKKLRIDALKWKLSKIIPKQFGDKVTQEITGAGGGPLVVANALDLKGLTDDELATMQKMLEKIAGANAGKVEG
jgi:hypothetical protein